MDGDGRRSRLRSFALGGLVGAAGAIATVGRRGRRSRGRVARRPRAAGPALGAFEDAPCFHEHEQRYGDGGEMSSRPSKLE